MPVTRSKTRSVANGASTPPPAGEKRKPESTPTPKLNQKRPRAAASKETPAVAIQATPSSKKKDIETDSSASNEASIMVPAVLTFSFEEAKQRLINVDHRFEDLFSKMPCKPFEHLEHVHPFR
jgi:DNA-3-methyladenine glycosylase II